VLCAVLRDEDREARAALRGALEADAGVDSEAELGGGGVADGGPGGAVEGRGEPDALQREKVSGWPRRCALARALLRSAALKG
jgi:hypothetical protein